MKTAPNRWSVYGARLVATTLRSTRKHDCTDAAAAMAFDFVFAVFPALLILSAFIGAFGIAPEDFSRLLDDLGIVLPMAFIEIVEENIEHLVDSSQSLLFAGVIGVIWSASASMSTTMTALNRALGLRERPQKVEVILRLFQNHWTVSTILNVIAWYFGSLTWLNQNLSPQLDVIHCVN